MEKQKNLELKNNYDEFLLSKDPKALTIELMVEKNLWLTRIRWIYTLFIFIFFLVYNALSGTTIISPWNLGLIVGLSVFGNIIFTLTLNRSQRFPSERNDHYLYTTFGILQLDFDLVVLSLLVFFSGGFNSPMLVLFIFYILISTFLVHYQKAFRNTITANILVVVLFFCETGLTLTSTKLTNLMAFILILFFAFFISSYLSRNLRANEEKIGNLLHYTRELSVTDGLTNLYNQSHFFLLLKLQLEKSKRYHTPFALIIFDVDHFKNYNDSNGHLRGSAALRRVGDLMRRVFRSSDIMAKYGGDEFVIILPNSDKVGAFLAGDRLRELIEEEPFEGEEQQPMKKITISVGISSYPEHGQTIEEIIDRADKALYVAKKSGRNKCVIYSEDLEEPKENKTS